jgi:hypothetical protein
MPRYICKTHNVELVVESDRRIIRAPYMVSCLLMTMKDIREGRHGECEIVGVG